MSHYIVIPQLEVANANAQPVWWMIGPPPVTAYLGFAHALALKLGVAAHDGVAIVHHDIQFLGERHWDYGVDTLLPQQFRAASFIDADDYSDKNKYALSTQPSARCRLKASLVIRFKDDDSFSMDDVPRILRGARLAGGGIVRHGEARYSDTTDIAELTKAVGSGFSIVERQDLMVLAEGERDMLDVILRLTRPGETPDKDRAWLLPTSLGYIEISPRRRRRHVRGDFPHAYAEALVGLVQYRSLRDAGLHFWRYGQPHPHVFVAST